MDFKTIVILIIMFTLISRCIGNSENRTNPSSPENTEAKNTGDKDAEVKDTEAVSKEEDVMIGPYKASFNLSTNMDYSIIANKEIKAWGGDYSRSSSRYPIFIKIDPYFAEIILIKWAGPMHQRFDNAARENMKNLKDRGFYNISKSEIHIDSHHSGVLVHGNIDGEPSEFWHAYYWPSDRTGQRVMCVITANLPWNISKNLLDTIHIEIPR